VRDAQRRKVLTACIMWVAAAAVTVSIAWAAPPELPLGTTLPSPLRLDVGLVVQDPRTVTGATGLSPIASVAARHRYRQGSSGFYSAYLVPSLSRSLRELAPAAAVSDPLVQRVLGTEIEGGVILQAGRQAQHAAKRAVKRYLLDASEAESWADERLERMVTSSRTTAAASGADAPVPVASRDIRFRFGFSRLLPRLDVRCPAGGGDFRLTVGVRGNVAIDYRSSALSGLHVLANHDLSSGTVDLAVGFVF
jgi:hypothetical protein